MPKTKAHIVAMANAKGGVGKTTSTMNIGAILALGGIKTLVIDADSTASLTRGLLGKHPEKTLYNALHGDFEGCIHNVSENLDIIPATPEMTILENELAALDDREYCLLEMFERLKLQDKYDFIFIDCPPYLNNVTTNALVCATDLIVPMLAEFFVVDGMANLLTKLEKIKRRSNPSLNLTGIIICKFDSRPKNCQEIVSVLTEQFGDKVFSTKIRRNCTISTAQEFGKDIYSYDPKSPGAEDYVALTKEILTRFGYTIK